MSFQVYTIFNTKLGRVLVNEYLVRYNWREPIDYNTSGDDNDLFLINITSSKCLFFSRSLIENIDWKYLKSSIVVPFVDADSTFHGTSFILL